MDLPESRKGAKYGIQLSGQKPLGLLMCHAHSSSWQSCVDVRQGGLQKASRPGSWTGNLPLVVRCVRFKYLWYNYE